MRRIFLIPFCFLFLMSCSPTGFDVSESYGLTLDHSVSQFYRIPSRDRHLALKGAMYTRLQKNGNYMTSGKLERVVHYYLGCIRSLPDRKNYNPDIKLDAAIELCAEYLDDYRHFL